MGQLYSLFFGDNLLDANSLLDQVLKDAAPEGTRIITLPREGDGKCTRCDRSAAHAFSPCGHRAFCIVCVNAEVHTNCPICNAQVHAIL